MTEKRSPENYMDCLTVLRKDGCMMCTYREMRTSTAETCQKRLALRDRNDW